MQNVGIGGVAPLFDEQRLRYCLECLCVLLCSETMKFTLGCAQSRKAMPDMATETRARSRAQSPQTCKARRKVFGEIGCDRPPTFGPLDNK